MRTHSDKFYIKNYRSALRVMKLKKGWLYNHILQFDKPVRAKPIKVFSDLRDHSLVAVFVTSKGKVYCSAECYSKRNKFKR